MKVYLASRYSTKDMIRLYAGTLNSVGVEVTSRWLEEKYSSSTTLDQVPESELSGFAQIDLEDVRRADMLVFFSVDPLIPVARGGRHVEFGYALGLGKPILVVGPKENIFHYLPQITFVSTWSEALKFLIGR